MDNMQWWNQPNYYQQPTNNAWDNVAKWTNLGGSLLGIAGGITNGILSNLNQKAALKQAKTQYNDLKTLRDSREKERDDFNDYLKKNWSSVWDRE
ncbi:hypothetical protein [Helicobacter sp. 13S00477-4]|uniref:hypothetical protein n=1 Tax=Helicobacter sp. 13S00477-4 TaxID=1905759 RepID=UPI00117B24BB|nr:hypothetical protein [Helicobacter sp. 13S00477-4]